MKLFSKEEVNTKRKQETRELTIKNERLASSLRKVLTLQKEVDLDPEKAKKVKEYQVWCEDLQKKMAKELGNLKAYQKLTEDKKEEYYNLIGTLDALQDKILSLKEEISRLDLQLKFKNELMKTNA